jgi:ABC-type antimicrobial peptide transport system permease subunit
MVYNVSSRARELGIKAAIGAGPRRIAADVIRQAATIVSTGIVAGAIVALASARLFASIFVPLPGSNVGVAGAVSLVLLAIGTLGALRPATLAARTDPSDALRQT